MLQIKRQYIDGDMQVTEYTKDGQTVSHIVKVPVQQDVPPIEPISVSPQETLEEKIARLEQQIQENTLIQFDVLATIYEELLKLKGSV
jgi:hypothetical protein